MLNEKQVKEIQEDLESAQKPIFFFHDDPDGAASFIQLLHKKGEGKGVIIKATPLIDAKFVRKVQEYGADRVFVLDIAMMDQEFIDEVKLPITWIDHHTPLKRSNVKYYNPRNEGKNIPPSYMTGQVAANPKDEWLALAGCIGDWYLPPFIDRFTEKNPKLLPRKYTKPEDVMFDSPFGEIVQILSFNLKGSTDDAITSVKVFSRIESPEELLAHDSARAKFLWKRYEKVKKSYDSLKTDVLKSIDPKEDFIVHTYTEDRLALSKDLSNELIYIYPKKVIVLAREKSGEMKCSIRSGREGPVINKFVEKAIEGFIGATGGGHEHACGANIKKEDFDLFVKRLKGMCTAGRSD